MRKRFTHFSVQNYPNLSQFTSSRLCTFCPLDGSIWMQISVASAALEIAFCTGAGAMIWLLSIVTLYKRRKVMSKRSFQLHRQLIRSLLVQVSIGLSDLCMLT